MTRMTLGSEWVGVFGTAIGGVLGVAGTVAIRWGDRSERRRERQEDFEREDHLRDLALRRELYSECLAATEDALQSMRDYIAATARTHEEARLAAGQRLNHAMLSIKAVRDRLALAAPLAVYSRFIGFYDGALFFVGVPDKSAAFETISSGYQQLLYEMRADLRFQDAAG